MRDGDIELYFTHPTKEKVELFKHIQKLCNKDRKIFLNILADYIDRLPEEERTAFMRFKL